MHTINYLKGYSARYLAEQVMEGKGLWERKSAAAALLVVTNLGTDFPDYAEAIKAARRLQAESKQECRCSGHTA